jgi:excisionase family DNA binding protein
LSPWVSRCTIHGMDTHVTHSLVDAGTVAEAIGIRASTVRRWAKEGRIPAVRLSSRLIRFELDQVLAAMDRSQKELAHGRCDAPTPLEKSGPR